MPRNITDSEASGSEAEEAPLQEPTTVTEELKEKILEGLENEGEHDDDDDDAAGEDEYIVEQVLEHRFEKGGSLRYLIKWKGYEKKSDQTWEPEENLEGAVDILDEYHKNIGGRPVAKPKAKRGRDSGTPQGIPKSKARRMTKNEATDTAADKGKTKAADWTPPSGIWEDDIQAIDTVEHDTDGLHVYVQWNNGRKTRHPIERAYKKCPQKMLHFYEQHL
ncbi:MAG: hypothetical protein M1838_002928 [Thelocarpon superellum]|nr:MAG: hypothetical protein M1838_002928 [Thelocarpon superellum]